MELSNSSFYKMGSQLSLFSFLKIPDIQLYLWLEDKH